MMTEKTFYNLIAAEFELDPVCIDRESRLMEDLGFDSLDVLQLVLSIEERSSDAGECQPTVRGKGIYPHLQTAVDAFAYLQSLSSMRGLQHER